MFNLATFKNWAKTNMIWLLIMFISLTGIYIYNQSLQTDKNELENAYQELQLAYDNYGDNFNTESQIKLEKKQVEAERLQTMLFAKEADRGHIESFFYILFQFAIALLLFLIFITSLKLIPYFNEFFLGQNKKLDALERRNVYTMLGIVFLSCIYLVVTNFTTM